MMRKTSCAFTPPTIVSPNHLPTTTILHPIYRVKCAKTCPDKHAHIAQLQSK
jgi:hypothetical protein